MLINLSKINSAIEMIKHVQKSKHQNRKKLRVKNHSIKERNGGVRKIKKMTDRHRQRKRERRE